MAELEHRMEIFVVGGAVRDQLLGLPTKDRDFVVVGATPEQMIALGYRPVGRDFPVFLHPETHEEYALARTERKTAPGYKGFLFHADAKVTLEQDLLRRDLTINAIARAGDGRLIDPHGGRRDLRDRVLRHVSPAFAEDPVRILRLARFAARFVEFRVADETLALCRQMVARGEVDALVAERVWQELARGLGEARPLRMFEVLGECGALVRLLPELAAAMAVSEPLPALGAAAAAGAGLALRWASLWCEPASRDPAAARAVSERLRAPSDCRDLAVLAAREAAGIPQAADSGAAAILEIFERCDAFRRALRFEDLTRVAGYLAPAAGEALARSRRCLAAARAVDAGAEARRGGAPAEIGRRVRKARLAAVERCLAG